MGEFPQRFVVPDRYERQQQFRDHVCNRASLPDIEISVSRKMPPIYRAKIAFSVQHTCFGDQDTYKLNPRERPDPDSHRVR